MNKLKFCLVVDTEADFYYEIPSPEMRGLRIWKWRLNNILGKIYKYPKNREGLVNLVNLLKKYKFPANFAIVGHLYLKSCNGWPHFSESEPEAKWYKRIMKKNWGDFDPCSNYTKKPGFYLGDFIEKEMKLDYFNFGLHAFSHEAYFAEKKEVIERSLDAGIEAARKLGIKTKIYDGPWHMINDLNRQGELISILKKRGFKAVFYAGNNIGLRAEKELGVRRIENKSGLKVITISKELDGTSDEKKFKICLSEIMKNLNQDKVYCVSVHDFTWNKSGIKKLERLIMKIKELESKNLIEILRF